MKKFCIFVMMLLLAACGGGGGGSSTVAEPEVPTLTGTITLNITDSTAKTLAAVSPDPQFVRIAVTNPSLRIAGATYKAIRDVALGSTEPVQFLLPAAAGYTVEVLYYATDTANNLKVMQKYGKSDPFEVVANVGATVGITVAPITVGLTPVLPGTQDFVYAGIPAGQAGDTYAMTATIPAVSPLQNAWSYFVQTTPFTTAKHRGIALTAHNSLLAPNSFTNGRLYYQGEFYAKASLLNTGEEATSWTFNYPNPPIDAAGDPSITLTVRGANVDLNNGSTAPLFDDTYAPRISQFVAPTAILTGPVVSPIKITATDNIGIVSYRIQETGAADAPADSDLGSAWTNIAAVTSLSLPTASYTIQTPLTPAQNNVVKLYVRVRDAAGNEAVLSQNVTVNPPAP